MIRNKLYVNTIMEETDLQRTYAMGSNIEIESDTECFVPLIMNGPGRLCVQTEKKQAEIGNIILRYSILITEFKRKIIDFF